MPRPRERPSVVSRIRVGTHIFDSSPTTSANPTCLKHKRAFTFLEKSSFRGKGWGWTLQTLFPLSKALKHVARHPLLHPFPFSWLSPRTDGSTTQRGCRTPSPPPAASLSSCLHTLSNGRLTPSALGLHHLNPPDTFVSLLLRKLPRMGSF